MNEAGDVGRAGPRRAEGRRSTACSSLHDEIDLPFGEIRVRLGGGLAGHNGLKSLRRALGSPDFARVRVGVGRPPTHRSGPRRRLRARALPASRASEVERWSSGPPTRPSRCRGQASRRAQPHLDSGADAPLRLLTHADEDPQTAALRARAAARSSRSRCVRTCSPRCSTATRPARRSSSPATTGPRGTSPPGCGPGSSPGPSATTRAAASPTSRTWRRRRTSSGCGSPRSTRCSSPAERGAGGRGQRRGAVREGARPGAAPARLHAARPASCSTSTRRRPDLVAAGYERVDQVEDRGQFAIRGGLLDLFPATEDRAVRVDLFGDEIESLRWFSTFTQRSLGDAEAVEVAPAAELAEEHRELAEIAALEEPPTARTSPSCCRSRTSTRSSTSRPPHAAVLIAGEEDVAPALADHWQDVCAAFHDEDAHHLYVAPEADRGDARRAGADPPLEHRPGPAASSSAPRPPTSPRAGSRRPSRSSRSSPARATARSSRSRAAARASGRPTTSAG